MRPYHLACSRLISVAKSTQLNAKGDHSQSWFSDILLYKHTRLHCLYRQIPSLGEIALLLSWWTFSSMMQCSIIANASPSRLVYLKEDSSVCLSEVDHLYWVHLKHRFISYLVSAGQVSNITVLEPMASISEQKQWLLWFVCHIHVWVSGKGGGRRFSCSFCRTYECSRQPLHSPFPLIHKHMGCLYNACADLPHLIHSPELFIGPIAGRGGGTWSIHALPFKTNTRQLQGAIIRVESRESRRRRGGRKVTDGEGGEREK